MDVECLLDMLIAQFGVHIWRDLASLLHLLREVDDEALHVGRDELVLSHWALHLHTGLIVNGFLSRTGVKKRVYDRSRNRASEGIAVVVAARVVLTVGKNNLGEIARIVILVRLASFIHIVAPYAEGIFSFRNFYEG